jgi:hypothetical protein
MPAQSAVPVNPGGSRLNNVLRCEQIRNILQFE